MPVKSGRAQARGGRVQDRLHGCARRAADAIKSRRVKSDKADAFALAEMQPPPTFAQVLA